MAPTRISHTAWFANKMSCEDLLSSLMTMTEQMTRRLRKTMKGLKASIKHPKIVTATFSRYKSNIVIKLLAVVIVNLLIDVVSRLLADVVVVRPLTVVVVKLLIDVVTKLLVDVVMLQVGVSV